MRLGEAILLGSLSKRSQGGAYFSDDNGACALGMAGVAAGLVETPGFFLLDLERTWPWINLPQNGLPCDCQIDTFEATCGFVVTHIFDTHVDHLGDWTLERLVDWIDSIDPTPREIAKAQPFQTYDRTLIHA